MAATPKIIVVGGGLAGLAAVIKIAEMGGEVDMFLRRPGEAIALGCVRAGRDQRCQNLKG